MRSKCLQFLHGLLLTQKDIYSEDQHKFGARVYLKLMEPIHLSLLTSLFHSVLTASFDEIHETVLIVVSVVL